MRRAPSSAPSQNTRSPFGSHSSPIERFQCSLRLTKPERALRSPEGPSIPTSRASPKVGATMAQSPPEGPSVKSLIHSPSVSEPVRVLPEPLPPRRYQTRQVPSGCRCSGLARRSHLAVCARARSLSFASFGQLVQDGSDGPVDVIELKRVTVLHGFVLRCLAPAALEKSCSGFHAIPARSSVVEHDSGEDFECLASVPASEFPRALGESLGASSGVTGLAGLELGFFFRHLDQSCFQACLRSLSERMRCG